RDGLHDARGALLVPVFAAGEGGVPARRHRARAGAPRGGAPPAREVRALAAGARTFAAAEVEVKARAARRGNGPTLDLSRRARAIEVSPTVAMSQRAAALKAQGGDVLDFSVGEPDQPTPKHIAAAAVAAIGAGRTRYTSSAGMPELRAAVAMRYKKDFNVGFSDSEVAITAGGKQALYLACQALLDRGDEAIIPSPHWPTFSEAVRLAGARPVLVRASEKDGFK